MEVKVNADGETTETIRLRTEERLREVREEREQTREEFILRLREIQDERKRAVMEGIDQRIAAVNEDWVARWVRVLERLGLILDKVEERAEKEGVDVSAEVAEARATIVEAEEYVADQADNVYTIEIGDEGELGGAVRKVLAEFKADLMSVQEAVKAAREAVRNVLVVVGTGGGDEE